MIFTIRSINS